MTETLITFSSRADGPAPRRPRRLPRWRGVQTRVDAEDGADRRAPGARPDAVRRLSEPARGHAPPRSRRRLVPHRRLARDRPDGWHRIVGRASIDIIKSGGFRIGAGEVEDALLATRRCGRRR